MDTGMNIVVVEDHDDLREVTVSALGARGHRAYGINCAEALGDELAGFAADVIIIDLSLPGEDGISLSRRLRAVNPELGIIMLTARDKAADVAMGYRSGADIYLTKPTSIEAMDAALQALVRRTGNSDAAVANYILKQSTRRLCGPAGDVDLSSIEYTLLAALAQAQERFLESWQLIELSGKSANECTKHTLEVQIVRLRKKLEQAGAPAPTVKSVRGMGYQLCVPVIIRKSG